MAARGASRPMAAGAAIAIAGDEIRGSIVVDQNGDQAPAAATLPDNGRPMSLPRYASKGPGVFLLHYVSRRLASHLIVLFAVLIPVGCAIRAHYGAKNPIDLLASRLPPH